MTTPNSAKGGETGTVSHTEEHKSSSSSSDSSTSDTSSSSTAKSSPPTTPPGQETLLAAPSLGPRTNHDASYSASPPRRSKKNPSPRKTSRLGAIDEHSSDIAPDIPTRNPNRKHKYGNATKFFGFGAYSRSDNSIPPINAYDTLTGPRGEKFQDLRRNRPFETPTKGSRRRKICLAVIAIVILLAIGLGVGLGVGLTRNKGSSTEDVTQPGSSDSDNSDPSPFPIGTWNIPTYLTTTTDDCTSQSSTWRCFPYTIYSSSSSSSFNTLTWRITSPTNSTDDLRISNTNPTFSYPFTNVLLTSVNANDARLAAYTFDFPYRKQVVPNGDITGDGGATRCYYNDTILSVRLYSSQEGAGGNIDDGNTTTPAGQQQNWPFAIEYEERIGNGPECFRYVNGLETESVTVAAGSGDCVCGYRNYGLE